MPVHRSLELARRPNHQGLLRIHERLHAETTTDVRRRHDAQLLLRYLEHGLGKRVAHEMRALGAGVEHRALGRRVPVAERVARLHRIHDNAVVDDLQRRDVRGLGEGGVGCGEIGRVVVPVEHQVAGNGFEQLRRAFLQGGAGVGDCRQGFVVDLNRTGGILRLQQGFGHDQRDRLSDMAHLVDREHGAGRVEARRTISVVERRVTRNIAKSVGLHVVAGKHKQDAGHRARCGSLDAAKVGMGRLRAYDDGMRHVADLHVVDVATPAGDQRLVFETSYGLAYAEFHEHPNAIGRPPGRHVGANGDLVVTLKSLLDAITRLHANWHTSCSASS